MDEIMKNEVVSNMQTEGEINREKPKKKNKAKLALIISISAGVSFLAAIAIVVAVLFSSVYGSDVVENTVNGLLAIDDSQQPLFEGFGEALGVEGVFELKLPTKMTELSSNLWAKMTFEGVEKEGKITLELIGKEQTYSLCLVYDEDNIGIKGLYDQDSRHLVIKRKGGAKAFEESVFNPDSKGKYALEKDEYQSILDAIKSIDPEVENEYEDYVKGVEDEAYGLLKAVNKAASPRTSFRFDFSKMALEKKVSYNLDKEDIIAIYGAVEEFVAQSEYLDLFLFDDQGNKMTKTAFCSKLKNMQKGVKDGRSIEFSYVVCQNRIIGISYSEGLANQESDEASETGVEDENSSPANTINVELDYGDGICEITINTTAVEKAKKMKVTVDNTVDITIENSEDSYGFEMVSEGKVTTEMVKLGNKEDDEDVGKTDVQVNKVGPTKVILDYNKTTGQYSFKSVDNKNKDAFEYLGKLLVDGENEKISFSVDEIKEFGVALNRDPICVFEIKSKDDDVDVEITKPQYLFEMDDKEITDFIRNIPFEKLEGVYKELNPNSTVFAYTFDGQVIYQKNKLVEIAAKFIEGYSRYVTEVCIKENIFPPTKVFMYSEELELYFILDYYPDKGNVSIIYTYNISEEYLENYHKAVFTSDGLEVHKLEKKNEIQPTCTKEGMIVYYCSVCKQDVVSVLPATDHNTVVKNTEFVIGSQKKAGQVTMCSHCGQISYAVVEGQSHIRLSHIEGDKYKLTGFTTEGEIGYFYIPDELGVTVELDGAYGVFDIVRIPDGVEVIKKDSFKADKLQVVVLPRSVKEIESGAFGDGRFIHAVFYEGSGEDWSRVIKNEYASRWYDIEVKLCPEGFEGEDILGSYIKLIPQKELDKVLTSFTNISASSPIFNDARLTLQGGFNVRGADYCYESDTLAVLCGGIGDARYTLRLYSSQGELKKSVALNIPNLYIIAISGDYVAVIPPDSNKFYLCNIQSGESEAVKVQTGYTVRDLVMDSGRVYLSLTSSSSGRVVCYDIKTKTSTDLIKSIRHPNFYHNKQDGMIGVMTNDYTVNEVYLINGKKGELMGSIKDEAGFSLTQPFEGKYIVSLDGDFYSYQGEKLKQIPSLPAVIKEDGNLIKYKEICCTPEVSVALVCNEKGVFSTAVKNSKGQTITLDRCYLGGAIVLRSGDVVLHGFGNGMVFVDMQ